MTKSLSRWQLFVIFDPATESTFAVLFVLFNPYTKKIIVIDEIYEQAVANMTVRAIWEHVEKKLEALKPYGIGQTRFVYDEAEAWFRNESIEAAPGKWLEPTTKNKTDKVSGLSLFKDEMRQGRVSVADKCVNFIKECENYVKDEKGNIPKKMDHLIDCFRYFLDAAGVAAAAKLTPHTPEPETKRHRSIESEMADLYDGNLVEI